MENEHPKPLSFEEWMNSPLWRVGAPPNAKRKLFNLAHQGLAGPPELKWEDCGDDWKLKAITPFGTFYLTNSNWSLSRKKITAMVRYDCQSVEDGKQQAQAHFEKLWWEMSKPAEDFEMKLDEMVKKLASELPKGYSVSLYVENGSSLVELETPAGTVEIEQYPEETLSDAMQKALHLALKNHKPAEKEK